jgi:hypothetical protein
MDFFTTLCPPPGAGPAEFFERDQGLLVRTPRLTGTRPVSEREAVHFVRSTTYNKIIDYA